VKEIEVLKNTHSGKWFIMLDQPDDEKFLVINADGRILTMDATLFGEPELKAPDQITPALTEVQTQAYVKYNSELLEEMKREAAIVQQRIAANPPPPPRPSSAPRKTRKPPVVPRGPLVMPEWSGSMLTFYRSRISEIQVPTGKFRVHVNGVGTFEMTKGEFQSVFSDVTLSAKYKNDGLFSFAEIPERAMQFLKNKA
jgi:hypothetical protein